MYQADLSEINREEVSRIAHKLIQTTVNIKKKMERERFGLKFNS